MEHAVDGLQTIPEKEERKQKKKNLLLGSNHGRDIGLMLQDKLGTEYKVSSIFKPNAPLAKVIENIDMLGKDLTKQDHIDVVGGPGNNLDINYNHYSVGEDLNFISKRTGNTNVGFVNLFIRHN